MKAKPSIGRELIRDGRSLAVSRYRDRVLGRLRLSDGRGKRALDLGCGDGMEAEYLAARGWAVTALDLFPHLAWVDLQKRWKGKIKFGTADAANLGEAAKGSFDLVFEKDMLHHVPDPGAVLAQMRDKMKPGGRLAVLECNRINPVFYLHLTLLGNHQHFTRAALTRMMDAAGLRDWTLNLIEARVWPVEKSWVQDAAEKMQDWAERVALLKPFLCYHLAEWKRPILKKGKRN